jgi:CRP-like cAMP-binding protein
MVDFSELKKFELLSKWSDGDLKEFIKYFDEKEYKTNEIIVNEQSVGQEVYLIITGKVRIEREAMGSDQTLKILEKGEFFGEMSLFDNYPRSATVRCFDSSKLLILSKDSYEKMRTKNMKLALQFSEMIIKTLSLRLRQTNKNLEILSLWLI